MRHPLSKRCWNVTLMFTICICGYMSAAAQVWTVLGAKAKGTGRDSSLAEAAQLSYRYDKQQDMLTFRVTLYGTPNQQAFGVNLVFDTGGDDASKMNWWGANNAFKFDKLITAWVTRGSNGYEGTIGVGDAAGARAKQFNNLIQNNLRIRIEGDSILIGIRRTDITDKSKMNLIAAVGSNERWNDDLPATGFMTIDLNAGRPTRGIREIDLDRNNLTLPAGYKTLPDSQAPLITKKGQGKKSLILVPGMYSGAHSFDDFIARNDSRYTFYVITPPGINGTAARPMPPESVSFGERTWTRQFEKDILQLIKKEKLTKPVIVAESYPASIAAIDLAVENPDQISSVVISGTNLFQFFPSPKDATRRTPGTLQERVESVNAGWAQKWFKYVTPETWISNDMPPEMLSSDLAKGQQASQEIEQAPLAVKIRYLCEFWAADVTRDLDKLQVPVLALVPGFDEKFLAAPAYSSAKRVYVDSWDTLLNKNPKIKVVRIPDAHLLVFEDQPAKADEAVAAFVVSAVDSPVDRWARAIGGREKIAAIKSIYREGTLEYGGYEGTIKVWHTADGKYRKEEMVGSSSSVEVFDGVNGTVQLGDQPVHNMTPAELEQARSKRYSNSNAMFFIFAASPRGTLTVSGNNTIAFKPEGGIEWRVVLDDQTSLPKAMVHQEGDRTITVTFPVYEAIDGIKLEKEIHRSAGGPAGAVIRFSKTIINQPMDASLFSISK